MKISEKTRISKIIQANEQSIDVIASINLNFNKLRNPILRKLLAPRVNIQEAAKIGGVSVHLFLEKLAEIGFEIELVGNENLQEEKKVVMKRENIVELDVRPILSGGTDPFVEIMRMLNQMTNNQTLLIINTFEPIPLLNKLKTQGYEWEVERPNANEVHTFISKSENIVEQKEVKITEVLEYEVALKFFEGKMNELDVRDLEMPLPMVSILEELENIEAGHALFVHHKRLPQYLLPELEARGFIFSKKEIDESNLKLIIYKKQ